MLICAALLPQYRGAAPINWAVINGEKETGVTTFFLDHDIDTGRIILQKRFPIPETANVEYVYDGLMHLGAELALETIDALIAADGNIGSIPQSEMIGQGAELKPAPKIFKDTCRIDFHKPAKQVYDFIRGLSPYPGAWTEIKKKETVVFFDDPKGDDDYVRFPEPTAHPSHKQSTQKIQVLKIFSTRLSCMKRGDEPVGSLRVEGKSLQVACLDEWLIIQELQLSERQQINLRIPGIHTLRDDRTCPPAHAGEDRQQGAFQGSKVELPRLKYEYQAHACHPDGDILPSPHALT